MAKIKVTTGSGFVRQPSGTGGASRRTAGNYITTAQSVNSKKINTSGSVASGRYGSYSQPSMTNGRTGQRSYGVALPLNAKRKK